MFWIMLLMLLGYWGVSVVLARVVGWQYEHQAEEEVLEAQEHYESLLKRQETLIQEKGKREEEATKIFTLYEMLKEVSHTLDQTEALEIFKRKLKDHVDYEDCQFIEELPQVLEEQGAPLSNYIFSLTSKNKKLGYLVVKKVSPQDKDKVTILGQQLALSLHRIKLYEEIEKLAMTDDLTQVFTRRYLLERFEEELMRSQSRKIPLTFLMIDVDHFKEVNDQFGHLTGDLILKEVSRIIRDNLREIDIAGRFGGEEFSVVLPETDREGAILAAERIRSVVEKSPLKAYDNTLRATVSIGISSFPKDGKTPQELIDKSDWALYRAKKLGRNQVCAFGLYQR